jgi:hypothetical protein
LFTEIPVKSDAFLSVFSKEIPQVENLDNNVIVLTQVIASGLLQMLHKMKLTETQ